MNIVVLPSYGSTQAKTTEGILRRRGTTASYGISCGESEMARFRWFGHYTYMLAITLAADGSIKQKRTSHVFGAYFGTAKPFRYFRTAVQPRHMIPNSRGLYFGTADSHITEQQRPNYGTADGTSEAKLRDQTYITEQQRHTKQVNS